MTTKRNVLWIALVLLVVSTLSPLASHSQCYLGSGCKPVDNLTYQTNGNGQVYRGDGASNNGSGGWTTNNSDVNQCLSCHYGTNTLPYLQTGHKNTLRKFAPGALWGGPDGALYPTNDPYYGSASAFDWTDGLVTIGWCNSLATAVQNGLTPTDPSCQYPYYTVSNANAPASYTPVAPTQAAGGVRTLFYLKGGWMNYGGTANPSATHLNTIFDSGFTGDSYPNGNFDCARCHATGYNFDASGPEPTQNTSTHQVVWIPDAKFSRVPSDGFIAPGTKGTSSWYLTGIQCERCHVADRYHPYSGGNVTYVTNAAATALCMECHREEVISPANPSTNFAGSIQPSSSLQTMDRGYCSDLSGSNYATCTSTPSNQWIYKPYVDHEAGLAFLNSPHAMFNGEPAQNAQHSPVLSVSLSGAYASTFSPAPSDPTQNLGCTGCHDPHQSTVKVTNPPQPAIVNTCDKCHTLAQNILQTTIHPAGAGTPFPTGTQADIPGACVTCHMQAALGQPNSHLFRISSDPGYYTFPTPDQFYNQDLTALNFAPASSPYSGNTYAHASWLDVDLACGQCHIGGDGTTNPYGLTLPPGLPGAHAYTRAQLAYWASVMHAPDTGVPNPMFSPNPGTYNTPQNIVISDAMAGSTIYYTTDGSLPSTSSNVYTAPISITATTTFRAMATAPGLPQSSAILAVYSILLPTAPPPLFSPVPSTYTKAQSVTLSNTLNLPMYYTLDGSIPTVSSMPYSGPISITQNTTINAITAAYGYITSGVSTGNYLIQAPTPTFSVPGGTYSNTQNVVISDTALSATIYYTIDGSAPTTGSTPCVNPCSLSVATTMTVKAIASGGGYTSSNVAVAAYTIAAGKPTFSPASGTYNTAQTVTISDVTSSSTIYYTTDGSSPTTSSMPCSNPCTVSVLTTTTAKAIAAGNGISQSGVGSATYTIAAGTPTFSPNSGTYNTAQTVTISDVTSGSTIYYTTNGSTPTTSSTPCSNPCTVSVSTTTTVKAIAAGNGISQSGVGFAIYTIAAALPTFSLGSGTYTGAQTVTISDATSGVSIYYTTNGSTPTTALPPCANPCAIAVSSSMTVKAIAAGTGISQSSVGYAIYTIH